MGKRRTRKIYKGGDKKFKLIIALNSFAGGKLRNLSEMTTAAIVKKLANEK